MLRTGELLSLRSRHVQFNSTGRKVLISLGFTKGGKRAGAAESVIVGYDIPVQFALCWKKLASSTTSLTPSPAKWRTLFSNALDALKLSEFSFRPYSLRRGGATWWFSKHQSLDQLMVQGRWQAQKTARIYVNEGLALLAEMSIPLTSPKLTPFLAVFKESRSRMHFTTLEPLPKGRRFGGRGKTASKKAANRRRK